MCVCVCVWVCGYVCVCVCVGVGVGVCVGVWVCVVYCIILISMYTHIQRDNKSPKSSKKFIYPAKKSKSQSQG